jgi:6,7-dimethyl-8-ribityllumazine synthase
MGKKNKERLSVAIVVSRFNKEISDGLLNGALKYLHTVNINDKNIKVVDCPGAFEIPQIAKHICKSKSYDAVICLGAVIKGDTAHFEYISYAVTRGLSELNIKYDIPVTFGVLTAYNDEQAIIRSKDDDNNKGMEAAKAAYEMIHSLKGIK